MYKEQACPCCGSKDATRLPAVVAPFLINYVVGPPPACCSFVQCTNCSFRYFDSRLTEAEVTKLYSGYRGEVYFQKRHRAEPWYSRKVNDGIAGDPEEIVTRNAALEDFLRPHIQEGAVTSVLDYGGDRGQFIPATLGIEKFVFELSDARPVEGVTRIASEAALNHRRFDFAMLLGVLEHCSDPLSILLKIRGLLQSSDSYMLVGVPYEWYRLDHVGAGGFYRWYIDMLLKCGPLLTLVDFYSTVFRVRNSVIPPLGILKCHEHLNFFNQPSITALLHRAGMKVIASSITQTCTYPARTFSLNVLAKPV